MGYDVHITRKEDWFDEDDARIISLDEWKDIVNNDPDMRLDNYAEATTTQGEIIGVKSDGLSVWTKYSGDGKDVNHAWFSFNIDRIVVKNPDDEIISKMLQIAILLKAKVQGDEGEVYLKTTDNRIINDQESVKSTTPNKPWWKF